MKTFAADRRPHQWVALGLALIIPVVIFILFMFDYDVKSDPPEQIIYVESWRADRSMEETRANNERRAAARKEAQEQRQKEFQKLQNQLGF